MFQDIAKNAGLKPGDNPFSPSFTPPKTSSNESVESVVAQLAENDPCLWVEQLKK